MSTNLCYNHLFFFFRNAFGKFLCFPRFLHFSTFATETSPPQKSLMADYLVNSCGFSREKALNLSSFLTRIDCLKKPNSVLKFLKDNGLSDSHIRKLLTVSPTLLSTNVEKTLKPKFDALRDLGFSRSEFADFIASNPNRILHRSVTKQLLPSIKFLRTLLPTDQLIIKVIKRSSARILTSHEQKYMVPNINLLQKCGVSDQNIAKFLWTQPIFLMQPTNRLKEVVEKVEEWGVIRNSGMFLYAAMALGSMSKCTLEAKFEIFRSFGWSEADIHSAFKRVPPCLAISGSKIQRVMDFLLNTVGCDRSYIVSHPTVLMYSLENRLIPRYSVMQTLKSRELIDTIPELLTILPLTEKKFIDVYVIRHSKEVPNLQELYMNSKSSSGECESPEFRDPVMSVFGESGIQPKLRWKFDPRRSVVNKYCEGEIKRTVEKEPKSV